MFQKHVEMMRSKIYIVISQLASTRKYPILQIFRIYNVNNIHAQTPPQWIGERLSYAFYMHQVKVTSCRKCQTHFLFFYSQQLDSIPNKLVKHCILYKSTLFSVNIRKFRKFSVDPFSSSLSQIFWWRGVRPGQQQGQQTSSNLSIYLKGFIALLGLSVLVPLTIIIRSRF